MTQRVTRADREKRNKHKGVVVWLTGLSGSGKTTIAYGLEAALFEMGCSVFVLDGDILRSGLNKGLGYDQSGREENIRRVGELAKLFAEAGHIVITAFISPYKKDRDIARALVPPGSFIEAYVNASLKTCEKRDAKGLYKKARAGEIKDFTGISAPYEQPGSPDIVIDTETLSEEESIRNLLEHLGSKGILTIK